MEIIIWLAVCALVAWFAYSRGRNPWLAGLLSVVFSPILMFIAYLIMGNGFRCPQCDEKVRKLARTCKNCGVALPARD
jgi:hypothetical protein